MSLGAKVVNHFGDVYLKKYQAIDALFHSLFWTCVGFSSGACNCTCTRSTSCLWLPADKPEGTLASWILVFFVVFWILSWFLMFFDISWIQKSFWRSQKQKKQLLTLFNRVFPYAPLFLFPMSFGRCGLSAVWRNQIFTYLSCLIKIMDLCSTFILILISLHCPSSMH